MDNSAYLADVRKRVTAITATAMYGQSVEHLSEEELDRCHQHVDRVLELMAGRREEDPSEMLRIQIREMRKEVRAAIIVVVAIILVAALVVVLRLKPITPF